MVEIVTDKPERDPEEVIQLTKSWQNTDYASFGREWVYKDIPRTIVIEELLLTRDNEIPSDYKFFCFNGKAELFQIDFDRFGNHTRNFYDRNGSRVDARIIYEPNEKRVKLPQNLDRAFQIADKLSEGFNFIRVDLYLTQDNVWFGEMTNFPGNGFEIFQPYEFDVKMGQMLELDLDQ